MLPFFVNQQPDNAFPKNILNDYSEIITLRLDGSGSGLWKLQQWKPISKINRANYDQIHEKSSKEEVQAILGPPTATSTEDKIIYRRTTWRYTEGDKYINLTFKNDELDSKDTNLGTR